MKIWTSVGAAMSLLAMAIGGNPLEVRSAAAQSGPAAPQSAPPAANAPASPPAVKMFGPNAILHVVADLTRSATFYRDLVGLVPESYLGLPSGKTAEIARLTNVPGADLQTQTFRIPGSEVRLVLLNFRSGGTAPIKPRLQDYGQVKTAIRVRDIDQQWAKVQPGLTGVFTSGGTPVRPEGPQGVNRAVITKDPDGAPLEFVFQNVPPIPDTVPATSNVVGGWASMVVQEIAPTLTFYQGQLGFEPRGPGRQATAGLLQLQGLPDATTTMSTSARIPGSMYSWFIYQYGGVERTGLNGKLSSPGVTAISLTVEDVGAALTSVTAAGATVETAGGRPVAIGGVARVFVRDPSGLLVELVQAR